MTKLSKVMAKPSKGSKMEILLSLTGCSGNRVTCGIPHMVLDQPHWQSPENQSERQNPNPSLDSLDQIPQCCYDGLEHIPMSAQRRWTIYTPCTCQSLVKGCSPEGCKLSNTSSFPCGKCRFRLAEDSSSIKRLLLGLKAHQAKSHMQKHSEDTNGG